MVIKTEDFFLRVFSKSKKNLSRFIEAQKIYMETDIKSW